MQNSAVRLKAIKTGGNSLNPPASMSLNLLSGAISSLVSFTRATTGTVTDFEGLIKNVKPGEVRFDGMRRVENLLTYSQDFSNAAWATALTTVSVVNNNTTAPDGTTTAATITNVAGTNLRIGRQDTGVLGLTYTVSIYVKRRTGSGAITLADVNGAQTTINVTSSWQRFSTTVVATSTTLRTYLYVTTAGDAVDIWGAQLENVTGQANQNPSEYVSTNAIRRNLLTYSENFDNAVWIKNVTSTSGSSITFKSAFNSNVTQNLSLQVNRQYTATYYVTVTSGTVSTNNFTVAMYDSITFATIATQSFTPITNTLYTATITGTTNGTGNPVVIGVRCDELTAIVATVKVQVEASPVATAYQLITDANPRNFNNYQGAAVDGVQYFPYTNPNCIINGAITQIPTIAINSSNSKFAYNCVASGDYFSTISSTANQITGDISLLVQVALDDWTPATVQTLVAKDGVSAGTRSWAFNIQTSGAPRLNYSLDGTNIISVTASASTGFTDGTTHFVGVQREAATGIIRFYTSEDGRTFTQLGTDQTGTAGSLYNATSTQVQFGNLSSLSFALDGKIYDSHVYTGLKFTGSSTMVMDFDPSNWTSGSTFTGLETGEVWTLNGNAKIYQGLWDAVGPKSWLIEEARTNVFLNSTAPATQSFTTAASPYTISFYGSGSITLSGSFVATVTGSNALTRTTLTFTPTAALLTMTVAGTITKPQLELGSFATSYIETAGAQVTRNADQASMTGTNFSSWFNASAGTAYCDFDMLDTSINSMIPYSIENGTSNGYMIYKGLSAINMFGYAGTNNAQIVAVTVANTQYKTGLAYGVDIAATANGATPVSIATGGLSGGAPNQLLFGKSFAGNQLSGHIRTIRYYSQRLPNSTLQSLTA